MLMQTNTTTIAYKNNMHVGSPVLSSPTNGNIISNIQISGLPNLRRKKTGRINPLVGQNHQ